MFDPFTIRIFVPDGDPEGVRLIDRMNWTGLGIAFPRSKWSEVRQRAEFNRAGVYILVGYQEEDLPTIYIGQADGVRNRIEAHYQNKDFWDWGIIFVSNSGGLNRAHVTWLEYALVRGNTNPRRAYKQQAAVELSPQGAAWLDERLEQAFAKHGKLPPGKLEKLDWPSIS